MDETAPSRAVKSRSPAMLNQRWEYDAFRSSSYQDGHTEYREETDVSRMTASSLLFLLLVVLPVLRDDAGKAGVGGEKRSSHSDAGCTLHRLCMCLRRANRRVEGHRVVGVSLAVLYRLQRPARTSVNRPMCESDSYPQWHRWGASQAAAVSHCQSPLSQSCGEG